MPARGHRLYFFEVPGYLLAQSRAEPLISLVSGKAPVVGVEPVQSGTYVSGPDNIDSGAGDGTRTRDVQLGNQGHPLTSTT